MKYLPDYKLLGAAQLDELRSVLENECMPTTDLADARADFFRFHEEGKILGYAGIEGQGADLLLRSLWISPQQRNHGTGARVLERIENLASERGGKSLHLLTTTAERFFLRHGYIQQERAKAPSSIAESREFQNLCPASAVYLAKSLRSRI